MSELSSDTLRFSEPQRGQAILVCVIGILLMFPSVAFPQTTWQTASPTTPTVEELQAQFDRQAELIRDLQNRLGNYESLVSGLGPGECNTSCCPVTRRLPVVAEEVVPGCSKASDKAFHTLPFYVDYDNAFALIPFDPGKTPFELRINGWIQFRHVGFARDVETWTDNAGVTREVNNRNAFDIERSRLYFKGFALDQRLTYFYHLDGDTDGRHGVDFFDYWWAWEFSDRFRIQFGKRKVPGSRQWLLGARRTRLSDRPMANDFFRPDRTVGIFALGRCGQTGHYEAMVGNGFRTANLPNILTDDQFTYAFTQYFDPFGDFGGQLADYDCTAEPLVRIGHSFVYSPTTSTVIGLPRGESDFLRLTDGTRINQTGAFAPNVTVSGGKIYLYTADLAWKWRGWSVNTEAFFRWMQEFEADGPLPVTDLFQRGFYVEGGKFLVPKKLDVSFRYSEVQGLYKDSTEYAAGFNWYPMETHKLKVTFDVTVLDGSPLQNTASEILVGDDGTLFRTQLQAEF